MDDNDNVAVEQEVDTSLTDSSSPQEEQEMSLDDSDTTEKSVQTPEAEDEVHFTKEQARAFQKLRQEKKQLEKELEARQSRQSQFEELQQVYAPAYNQAGVDPKTLIDERINDRFDEIQARQEYPQLNTDKKFERVVAAEYQARLMETIYDPSKTRPSIREIAKEMSPHFADVEKAKGEAVKQAKEKLTEKEQAALSATGLNKSVGTSAELERLQASSRTGDNWAIAERLKRLK